MKLKELFYGLGIKPPAREYTFDLDAFHLPKDGEVHFARWKHPKEKRKTITQAAVDAVRSFLREGDAAIDIGAHSGYVALTTALATGSGPVFALEPNRYAFKVLLANAALNRKKTNIFPLPFAATPEDGEYEFEYSDAGYCNGGRHEGVNAWRHAHFFKLQVIGKNLVGYLRREFPEELAKIRYVKIDTEGFDHRVALSIQELLTANRPFLRTEIFKHTSQEQRIAYYDDLRDFGYTIHKWNGDEDYCGDKLSRKDLMNWKCFDLFAIPEG